MDTHEVTIARYRRFLAESDITIDPSTPIDLPVGRVGMFTRELQSLVDAQR